MKLLLHAVACATAFLLASCDSQPAAETVKATPPAAPSATERHLAPPPPTVVGKTISFGKGGESELYRLSGWCPTGGIHTWTQGTSATLALPILGSTGPLTVKMNLRGMTKPPELAAQPVEVYANGQKIAEWQVAQPADFDAAVPAEVLGSASTLNIELRMPRAASPKALGTGPDTRLLGVLVRTVALAKAAP